MALIFSRSDVWLSLLESPVFLVPLSAARPDAHRVEQEE
jgi:hypothetical protein